MHDLINKNKRNTKLLFIAFLLVNIILWYGILTSFELSYYFLFFILVYSITLWIYAYYFGDKIILKILDSHIPTGEFRLRLERIVEEMSLAAGIPKPNIYVINSMTLNACAVGRNPANASIVLTSGLLFDLNDEELRAVIAHETSHIMNFDILYHTILSALLGVANLLKKLLKVLTGWDASGGLGVIFAIMGLILPIFLLYVAGLLPVSLVNIFIGELLLMIFLSLFFFGGRLIQSLFSQNRELLADSSAILLTRYPIGLINAFKKMSLENNKIINSSSATAHLFLLDPLHGFYQSTIFQTHPPIQERIEQIRNITEVPTPNYDEVRRTKEGSACIYKSKKIT